MLDVKYRCPVGICFSEEGTELEIEIQESTAWETETT